MSDSSSDSDNADLNAIIAECYEAREQGRVIDRAALLAKHPELRAELTEFFADWDQMANFLPDNNPPQSRQQVPGRSEQTHDAGERDSSHGARRGGKIKYFGEYEILDEVGSGGMGVVYKARQAKLRKIVAVKMIRTGELARPREVQRFQAEARAAAKLDHPGIVSVHEVGVHEGHYYYTMDFVGGGSLSQLHRDEPIAAQRSAELVKQLAEAMFYAHSQGIVHRDLKPANILLTTTGVPRITDFGLAKRLWNDEDSAEASMTETGQVLGTAGYMSPEQAAGQTRMVGPAADIYALGAILYAMLTTRAPFIGESAEATIRQVIHNEPIAPHVLNGSIPRDLETICLKCLAKEPHKRYGTAQLLAEDLQRFLEGRPVLARPVSRPARAWRWCRRNPVIAALATSVVILLIVGSAISTTLAIIASNNAELAIQQTDIVTKKSKELESTIRDLDTARKEAEQNEKVAREQSQLALKSLESVIFDIQRSLENAPGTGELRRSLLQTALAQLRKVSESFVTRPAIDRSTVAALHDLGDVFLKIGASPEIGGDGPSAEATKVYQRALDISQQLAVKSPKDATAQRELARSYGKLGDARVQSGQVAEAIKLYQQGFTIANDLANQAGPGVSQALGDLAAWHARLGDLQLREGQVRKALDSYQQGAIVSERWAEAYPNDPEAQRTMADWYARVGDGQLQAGEMDDAIKSYQKSTASSRKFLAENPHDYLTQLGLSSVYPRLTHVLLETGDVAGAMESSRQGLDICLSLEKSDPKNVMIRRDLARAHVIRANAQLKAKEVNAALESYNTGLKVIKELAESDPTDADAQRGLSITYERLGDAYIASNQLPGAIGTFQSALTITKKLAESNPSDTQAQLDQFTSHYRIASAYQQQKQFEQAIESYRSGIQILLDLQKIDRLPAGLEHWIGQAQAWVEQCEMAPIAMGDWEALFKQPPNKLLYLLDLRAQLLAPEGRTEEALQAVTKLRALGTTNADHLYNSACVYCACARAAKSPAEREKFLNDAVAVLKEAIAAGYANFEHMASDRDLAAIQDLPAFKELLPSQ